MSKPVVEVSGVTLTDPMNISIQQNHSSPTATLTVDCTSHTLDIGSEITVDIGYTTADTRIFSGYVKQISRKVPEDVTTIIAQDSLVRATDYFVAADDPDEPFSRSAIQAEDLVGDLLELAQLTNYTYDTTYFTVAYKGEAEVNLVTVYDYCKSLGDAITWTIWADENGQVHFESRKPYVMTGDSGLPGDKVDVPIDYEANVNNLLEINYAITDRSLRNKIIVYGDGVQASAEEESPYLPTGFRKIAVIGAGLLFSEESQCQEAADLNLYTLNRLTKNISCSVIGDPVLKARECITINYPRFSLSGTRYIYSCEHSITEGGYITRLELRQ